LPRPEEGLAKPASPNDFEERSDEANSLILGLFSLPCCIYLWSERTPTTRTQGTGSLSISFPDPISFAMCPAKKQSPTLALVLTYVRDILFNPAHLKGECLGLEEGLAKLANPNEFEERNDEANSDVGFVPSNKL
jgi:hypothetical protein